MQNSNFNALENGDWYETYQLWKDLAELRQARQAIMLAYTGKRCSDNTQG